MDLIPIAVFWCLAAWAFVGRSHRLVYLFFGAMSFGSFAVVPPALLAGLTLTPAPIVAVLLIVRHFIGKDELAYALGMATRPSRLAWLFLFWAFACITTLFMPRLFAGEVVVVPLRQDDIGAGPLAPSLQNLSQLLYLSISVAMVFVFTRMLRTTAMRRHVLAALCLGAAMAVFTGLLDFGTLFLPLEGLLEPFRTATYALLTSIEVVDGKRVVGLMPEASTFGYLTLSFLVALYFLRRAMPAGLLRDRIVPVLLVMLVLLLWLSTSSAAYLGFGVFACAAVAEWGWRAVGARRNPYLHRGLLREFMIGLGVLTTLLLLVVAFPQLLAPVTERIDTWVLQKAASSSFEERNMWTQVAWDAVAATYGLGVGLGGTRASNLLVALASNAGVLATLCYLAFVVQCLGLRRAAPFDVQGQALLVGIRWAYAAPFVSSLVIGTSPDFGLFNAFLYGFAMAATSAASSFRAQVSAASSPFSAARNAHGA
ncbi:hypothetical protein [Xenophilus sp.]|uniref:hypothetical protein n=1 Tax=Xenophilus sp. TaxID=1873499 RepID=UPI0037DD0155